MNIGKMNVYIVTKNKVTRTEKEGRWFTQLFLPLFKSNKDPLKKQPQLNDYWNEIRNCLLGKKKNKSLKVIKHKDIKFIAFSVANNQVLAFATGTEKSEALNDIYKITQEKSEGMNFTKFLKLIGAQETEAVHNIYQNLCENLSEEDIKEQGYKTIEEMIKNRKNDLDFENFYLNGYKLGNAIELSNYNLKEWAKNIIQRIYFDFDIVKDYKDENKVSKIEDKKIFGKWVIEEICSFSIIDCNGHNSDLSFNEFINYLGNKDIRDSINRLCEVVGQYFIKDHNNKFKADKPKKETMADKLVKNLDEYDWAREIIPGQICENDPETIRQEFKDSLREFIAGYTDDKFKIEKTTTKNMLAITFTDKSHIYIVCEPIERFICLTQYNNKYLNGHPYKSTNKNNKDQEKLQMLYDYLKKNCQDDFEWEEGSADVKLKDDILTINYGNASYTITCKDQEYKVVDNVTNTNDYYGTIAEVLEILGIQKDSIRHKNNNFEGTGMSEEDIHNLSNEDMEELGINDNQFYKFKVYLYQNSNDFEPFSEYKKLENHFDYLIGDNWGYVYRNIKVIDHITNQDDPVLIIEGEVAGISKDDFFEDLIARADENYDLSDGDIVEWKKV